MAGGGVIIIRRAMKQALGDSLVWGTLPDWIKTQLLPVMGKSENDWTEEEEALVFRAFVMARARC